MNTAALPLFAPVLALALLVSLPAQAEKAPPRGTAAVVCRHANGVLKSAETVDLYEARVILDLRPIPVKDVAKARVALQTDLRRRFAGISVYPIHLETAMANLRTRFRVLPAGQRLKLLPDLFPRITQPGCGIEQLASFDGEGPVQLDAEIFAALDPINRLSLQVHEAAAYLDRKWTHAKDSVFVRKLVGLLLADQFGEKLDAAVAAYRVGYPRSGKYRNGVGICEVKVEAGNDGTLRLSPQLGCRSTISWDAFESTGVAILFPTGMPGEWRWVGRPPAEALTLQRLDAANLILDGVSFRL